MSDAAPTAPAGWYPDSEHPGGQRYWDGSAWTEYRYRAAAPASQTPEAIPVTSVDSTGLKERSLSYLRRFSTANWVIVALLGFVVIVMFAINGFGGGLGAIGLIALVTGAYVLITKRPSWAKISGRKVGAGVLAAGLVTTLIGTSVSAATSGEGDEVAVAISTETATPAPAKPTPTPTPTPTGEPDAPENATAAPDAPSVSISDSSATQMSAIELLGTLPVKGRAPKTGFDRKGMFGTAWLDVDRNGCDTRNDILARDLEPEVKSGPCKVTSGSLADPYTGKTINFVRGNSTSLAVQIDHVVSLMNAWETGAQGLTQAQRVSLANDPINLFAVDGPTNIQKGAGDAATWLPPKKDFRCTYVAHQISVKATYGLWVTQPEHDAMTRILQSCADQPSVTSAFAPAPPPPPAPEPAPEPVPAPEPAPAPAPAPAPVYYENCDAVRAAGAAPIHAGDPGYSRKLDRDGDGVGCE